MKYKFCVIGTGIGGGILIEKLIRTFPNEKIIVIEAGNNHVNRENLYVSTGLPFRMITTSVQLGGTSNLWHGVLSYLDDIDFKKRDWISKSGWPIEKQELYEYYNEAAKFWGVENTDFFEEENLSVELKEELKSINFNKEIVENKLFQQPLNVKSLKTVIAGIAKKDNLTLLTETVALELKCRDTDNKTIQSCVVGRIDGNLHEIEADNFIVCAGALETPRLLLNSKFLDNYNIGKYLMDHPMGNLLQIRFKKPQKAKIYSDTRYGKGTKIKTGLVFKSEIQEKYELPNHNFYIRPSFVKGIDDMSEKIKLSLLTYKSGKLSIKDIYRTLTNLNVIRQILTYKLSLNVTYKFADLFFLTEQVPNEKSKVGLSTELDRFGYPKAEVDWQLAEYDISNMKKVFEICRNEVFPDKDFEIIHSEKDFLWDSIFTSGAHHVGTARMSNSSEDGVVDKDLKVFDTNNLFICDGSIFPTSGNVNIGLTISAFALRLVDYFREKTK
jgi:choline dehydrogenase-like flavoprotein